MPGTPAFSRCQSLLLRHRLSLPLCSKLWCLVHLLSAAEPCLAHGSSQYRFVEWASPPTRSPYTRHLLSARYCSTHKGRSREQRASLGAYVLVGKTAARVQGPEGGKRSRAQAQGELGRAEVALVFVAKACLRSLIGCEEQISTECVFPAEGPAQPEAARALCSRRTGRLHREGRKRLLTLFLLDQNEHTTQFSN